jgi:hypothetical protein
VATRRARCGRFRLTDLCDLKFEDVSAPLEAKLREGRAPLGEVVTKSGQQLIGLTVALASMSAVETEVLVSDCSFDP